MRHFFLGQNVAQCLIIVVVVLHDRFGDYFTRNDQRNSWRVDHDRVGTDAADCFVDAHHFIVGLKGITRTACQFVDTARHHVGIEMLTGFFIAPADVHQGINQTSD